MFGLLIGGADAATSVTRVSLVNASQPDAQVAISKARNVIVGRVLRHGITSACLAVRRLAKSSLLLSEHKCIKQHPVNANNQLRWGNRDWQAGPPPYKGLSLLGELRYCLASYKYYQMK